MGTHALWQLECPIALIICVGISDSLTQQAPRGDILRRHYPLRRGGGTGMVRHVVNNSSFGFCVIYVELEQDKTVGHVGAVVGCYSAVGLLLHWRKSPEKAVWGIDTGFAEGVVRAFGSPQLRK